MMDALENVEKELKKPLMRNDKKGMALTINMMLGIQKEDLPKYEEQLELKIAKVQLEELKKVLSKQWKLKRNGSGSRMRKWLV